MPREILSAYVAIHEQAAATSKKPSRREAPHTCAYDREEADLGWQGMLCQKYLLLQTGLTGTRPRMGGWNYPGLIWDAPLQVVNPGAEG